jgi:hypothetical protein
VPDAVRRDVLGYVEAARAENRPWAEITETVGLSKSALTRWRRSAKWPRQRVRPVRVVSSPAAVGGGSIAVVTPTGHRLEGLSLAEAIEAARSLG